jgi:2-polyprenyl-3-methyl-5-hydroxy-6-metoxy-1,4-benzoquinol methylase
MSASTSNTGSVPVDAAELARWNKRYAQTEYVFGKAPNAFLASQAPLLRSGMRALSVADGEGRNSVWLAEQGLEVTAFDFSPPALEKARTLAAERGVAVNFEQGDIYGWRWPVAAYDVVVAIFVQFADPAMRAFKFERMRAALKPGGLILLQGYTPRQLEYRTGGPSMIENLYTPELLQQSFAGMEIVLLTQYERELNEGARHAGMSAVIDLVARQP